MSSGGEGSLLLNDFGDIRKDSMKTGRKQILQRERKGAQTDDTAFRQGVAMSDTAQRAWACVWWGRPPAPNHSGVLGPNMKT